MKKVKVKVLRNNEQQTENELILKEKKCYDLRLKVLSDKTTLVLNNTRELDRVPSTEQFTLYTNPHGPC